MDNVEGIDWRSLRLANPDAVMGYFYFTLDPTFNEQDVARVRIDVVYFDEESGVFGLQYDATGAPTGSSSKALLPNVPFRGSKQWRTNSFTCAMARSRMHRMRARISGYGRGQRSSAWSLKRRR